MSSGYEKFFAAARASKGQAGEGALRPDATSTGNSDSKKVGGKAKRNMAKSKEDQIPLKKKSKAPSIHSVLLLVLISAGLGWWTVDPDLPDRISKMVEVRLFGAAQAESKSAEEKSKGAESASSKDKPAEKAAQTKGDEKSPSVAGEKEAVSEDTSHLEKLRVRSHELDQREKELTELEEELHKQKLEIEARIRQLENLRAQISGVLKERMEVDQEKVNRLVETYSNMKPKQAAEIIAGLDEDLAVEVMGKMKKKNAAEIMNLLESGKARALSEKYAGFKKR